MLTTTHHNNNYFVFTGGPGSGKTTIIHELVRQGYRCIPESGRQIIQQQVAIDSDALPWKDAIRYKYLMQQQAVTDYITASAAGHSPVFFDRGIPDIIGYERIIQAPADTALHEVAIQYRYASPVFIFPPWEAIYKADAERKQSYTEAVTTYHAMTSVYTEYGYTLLEVPHTTITARVAFILSNSVYRT